MPQLSVKHSNLHPVGQRLKRLGEMDKTNPAGAGFLIKALLFLGLGYLLRSRFECWVEASRSHSDAIKSIVGHREFRQPLPVLKSHIDMFLVSFCRIYQFFCHKHDHRLPDESLECMLSQLL